jgi:CheY-like chemotaxis protein
MAETKRKRILVVDDDETHLKAIRDLLEMEGYEVHLSSQSMGTSKLVLQLAPDLILMDVSMPTLTGDKLAGIIKRNELTASIPLVFLSGNSDTTLRELVQQCGATGYIRKGDPSLLRSKVASFLGSPLRARP